MLVAAGRAALGLDTGSRHIREAVEAHRKLDAPNFGSTLTNMEEIALRGRPGAKNRLVRLRANGVDSARRLAAQIVGA